MLEAVLEHESPCDLRVALRIALQVSLEGSGSVRCLLLTSRNLPGLVIPVVHLAVASSDVPASAVEHRVVVQHLQRQRRGRSPVTMEHRATLSRVLYLMQKRGAALLSPYDHEQWQRQIVRLGLCGTTEELTVTAVVMRGITPQRSAARGCTWATLPLTRGRAPCCF